MASNRVLIVSHSYAPQQNPRALRWDTIARFWASRGVIVDIVTAGRSGLPDFEAHCGVTVYRVGNRMLERTRTRFTPSKIGSQSASQVKRPSTFGGRALRVVHDLTWKKLYWPDYACLWISPAARKIQSLLEENQYTAVISVSEPYSAHLAVCRALEQSLPIRWLVDISDPFSARELAIPNNQRLYAGRNRRIESKILSLSSNISVTTPETALEYARLFPQVAGKLQVIGPLMSKPEVNPGENPKPSVGRGKRFVFVGTLYGDLRHPGSLIRHLIELIKRPGFENSELHLFGSTVGSSKLFDDHQSLLNRNVFVHGIVPRGDVLSAMSEADILVNIGNRSTVQLPSKIAEYVWAGKPIWNLTVVAQDCAASYLKDYPSLLNQVAVESGPTFEQISELVEFVNSAPFQIPDVRLLAWRERSAIQTIARQYADLCELTLTTDKNPVTDAQSHCEQELSLSLG